MTGAPEKFVHHWKAYCAPTVNPAMARVKGALFESIVTVPSIVLYSAERALNGGLPEPDDPD